VQHTPPTQNVDPHSVDVAQDSPIGRAVGVAVPVGVAVGVLVVVAVAVLVGVAVNNGQSGDPGAS